MIGRIQNEDSIQLSNDFVKFLLFQLSENLGGKIVFVPLQSLDLNYEMINFGWMNTRCLAVLDQVRSNQSLIVIVADFISVLL